MLSNSMTEWVSREGGVPQEIGLHDGVTPDQIPSELHSLQGKSISLHKNQDKCLVATFMVKATTKFTGPCCSSVALNWTMSNCSW